MKAKWIWKKQPDYNVYNQGIIARKEFRLDSVAKATVRITADTRYRLFINGEWVGDGPSRAWPEHYLYDVIDVTAYLTAGWNIIGVIARYSGVGDFHRVPRQAGLLCQLDVTSATGKEISILSDRSWEVADAGGWRRNTPKICIQREPMEIYDARKGQSPVFEKAAELFPAGKGPWRDLQPRVTALLTRRPVAPRRFMRASLIVEPDFTVYWFPTARLTHPGLIEANNNVSAACVVATVVHAKRARKIRIEGAFNVTVNGQEGKDCLYSFRKGDNFLMGVTLDPFGHVKERSLRLFDRGELRLSNPVEPAYPNPWCFIRLPEADCVWDDLRWWSSPSLQADKARTMDAIKARVTGISTAAELKARFKGAIRCLPASEMLLDDPHDAFMFQKVGGPAGAFVRDAGACLYDNAEVTTVTPARDGDVQLAYDLGEQVCGYYEVDLVAAAGTVVDVFGVEYIRPDGVIQHTEGNRNGMRFICEEGRNRFVSFDRRSGRYLFVTLRNMAGPVALRKLGVIESTYPVQYRADFACSDARLDKIWEISERTLKLCMEDTFTDCPLYEQTLWVGDSRNEALFAYTTFGATDIARNCLTIAGQSLERYPIVGCQVPSAWDCLLPAWSFMWGMAVWEYYFYSGDAAYVRRAWPWVMKNLKGAARLSDKQGLFSAHMWNMFDWGGIVDASHMVLHNTLFIVGAINAALKSAATIHASARDVAWLKSYRGRLVKAINGLWDSRKKAYPDAFDGSDKPVDHTCQHTSFLSVLYDVADARIRPHAIWNMTNPPADMGRVSSPFAIMFFFESLEKVGLDDTIVESIFNAYLPMLKVGATTVWEVFPDSPCRPAGFPTRSHCHAWSSAPLYFLPRIVLGIRQTKPGCAAFDISPRLNGLKWAEGRIVTPHGLVGVRWERKGKALNVSISAPKGVKTRFVSNETLKGLKVTVTAGVAVD